MSDLRIEVAAPGRHRAEAAVIWAEATAARDGDSEAATLDEALPVIEKVTEGSPRSRLSVAITPDGQVTGFAAIEPDGPTAHVRYVGVSPRSWGGGVGRRLMTALPELVTGCTHGELEVYLDNTRAVALYESLGWQRHGEPQPHPRSGRLEQRYRRALP